MDDSKSRGKNRGMNIFYKVYGNLYVNLTNKCPCACTFCLRQGREELDGSGELWLDHDPTFAEVAAALEKTDMTDIPEVVFCGFGEPTEALDVLLETAKTIKAKYNKPIRLNTNGLGDLINGRKIAPLFDGLIDTVSISLNTPDEKRYMEIVRPSFGEGSYRAMLDFAGDCVKHVPNVVMTTVATTLTKEEDSSCRAICAAIGARYRVRDYIS